MEELLINVNWRAVIVGAIAAYALGALWYSQKLFGRAWMEGSGVSMEGAGSMTMPMIAQAVAAFLLAWVIGITETTGALATAILIALMAAALVKANGLWTGKSKAAVAIDGGYVLAMAAIMIAAHALL